MTYPYGAHAAVVEVDTGTGQVRVLRYLVAYEVGRAINPMLVEGQLRGGVAQGIGGALFEEFRYDEAGQPQAITFIETRHRSGFCRDRNSTRVNRVIECF